MKILDKKIILIFFLILQGYYFFFWAPFPRSLWVPDETRYALVAKEMAVRNDFILPHYNGEIYADKPPLFFWLINFFNKVTKNPVRSVTLPSAWAGFGTSLLVFLIGLKLFGCRSAFAGAGILSTTAAVFAMSHYGLLDMTLTFFETLALLGVCDIFFGKNSKISSWLLWGGCGLAVLTKGPVGLIPAIIFFITLFFYRRNNKVKISRHILPVCFMFAIVLTWYLWAVYRGGKSYLSQTLIHQSVHRFAGVWRHKQPFYYFLKVFPLEFLPWSLFLPVVLIGGIRDFLRDKTVFLSSPGGFLWTWFSVVFLFFSAAGSKLDFYILPLYPAMSLLLADFLLKDHSSKMRSVLYSIVLVTFVSFIAGVAIFYLRSSSWLGELPFIKNIILGAILVTILPGWVVFLFCKKEKKYFLPYVLMFGAVLIVHIYAPLVEKNRFYSADRFGDKTNSVVSGDKPLYTYRLHRLSFLYVLNRIPVPDISNPPGLKDKINDKECYVIMEKRVFEEEKWGVFFTPVFEERVRKKNLLLLKPHL